MRWLKEEDFEEEFLKDWDFCIGVLVILGFKLEDFGLEVRKELINLVKIIGMVIRG